MASYGGSLIFQAQEALSQPAHQQFALRRGIAIQTSAQCDYLVGQLSNLRSDVKISASRSRVESET
jgi:hypothetical protein